MGEESIAGAVALRHATATSITACTALKIERAEMIRVMQEEHEFSDLFLKFLLAHSMRTQADLVDQLFNSSEKRLARVHKSLLNMILHDQLPNQNAESPLLWACHRLDRSPQGVPNAEHK